MLDWLEDADTSDDDVIFGAGSLHHTRKISVARRGETNDSKQSHRGGTPVDRRDSHGSNGLAF
jgi:hypothetical protein